MTSINTVRAAADRLYGENKWNLAENYCNNVGMSKRNCRTSRKVYSLDNGQHWHLAAALVKKMNDISDKLGR